MERGVSATISVVRPGILTTVQDQGRRGYQGLGVPVAGPMDWYSHQLANQLAGNDASAAALEVTLIGPELQSDAAVECAVAGAAFDLTIDGQVVSSDRAFVLPAGARLPFGARRRGARATPAFAGGIGGPATVSRSDLPLAGQRAPGGSIEFMACARDEALEALRERVASLAGDAGPVAG